MRHTSCRHRQSIRIEKTDVLGENYHTFDCGGGDAGQRKWRILLSESTTSIFVVVSLDLYNQSFPDNGPNAMDIALEVYKKLMIEIMFWGIPIFLFLN